MASFFSAKHILTLAIDAVLVLAAACHETFAWTHWPVYAAALCAQLVLNTLFEYVRARLHDDERPRRRVIAGLPTVVEITLMLPALSVAAVADDAPSGAALTWAALFAIAAGVLSERSGRSTSATPSSAKPGRAMSLGAACSHRRLPRRRPGSSTFTPSSCLPRAGAAERSRRSIDRDASCVQARSARPPNGGMSAAAA
jgi:hypothetical protein